LTQVLQGGANSRVNAVQRLDAFFVAKKQKK
jgi:hypothetical protein